MNPHSKFTLGRDKRLKNSDTISDVLRQGRRKVGNQLRLHYQDIHIDSSRHTQIAFLVPKRIFKKASQRNRVKRWMKEAYRNHQSLITHCQPMRLILIVHHPEINSYQDVEGSVIELLSFLSKR